MGHCIQVIVAEAAVAARLVQRWPGATTVALPLCDCALPLTEPLYDALAAAMPPGATGSQVAGAWRDDEVRVLEYSTNTGPIDVARAAGHRRGRHARRAGGPVLSAAPVKARGRPRSGRTDARSGR